MTSDGHGGASAFVWSDDPLSVFERGMYFDGVDDIFTINGFTIDVNHTIELWVMIWDVGKSFFVINYPSETDGTDVFYSFTQIGGRIGITLRGNDYTGGPDTITTKQWTHLAVSAAWNGAETIFLFYRNASPLGSSIAALPEFPVLDAVENIHLLGAQYDSSTGSRVLNEFFKGFIYKLCISNFASDIFDDVDLDPDCGLGYCSTCPADVCLMECDAD